MFLNSLIKPMSLSQTPESQTSNDASRGGSCCASNRLRDTELQTITHSMSTLGALWPSTQSSSALNDTEGTLHSMAAHQDSKTWLGDT